MELTEILAIVTAGADTLTSLGILPYIFAGAVVGLVARFAMAAKKAGR